jgi:hypothetical protein
MHQPTEPTYESACAGHAAMPWPPPSDREPCTPLVPWGEPHPRSGQQRNVRPQHTTAPGLHEGTDTLRNASWLMPNIVCSLSVSLLCRQKRERDGEGGGRFGGQRRSRGSAQGLVRWAEGPALENPQRAVVGQPRTVMGKRRAAAPPPTAEALGTTNNCRKLPMNAAREASVSAANDSVTRSESTPGHASGGTHDSTSVTPAGKKPA